MNVKKNLQIRTEASLEALGADLRALRKAQNMTLADLSAASGRSMSFLSKIERGQARPSVTSLQEVAEALGVPVGWFFETDEPAPAEERPYIVRADRRRRLTYSGLSGTEYMGLEDHLLSASLDRQLALGLSTYEPGGSTGDDLYTHEGEEAGLVLKGEIELTLGHEVFTLRSGDSFSFSADIPHCYRNRGTVEAEVIWANTPVSLKR